MIVEDFVCLVLDGIMKGVQKAQKIEGNKSLIDPDHFTKNIEFDIFMIPDQDDDSKIKISRSSQTNNIKFDVSVRYSSKSRWK